MATAYDVWTIRGGQWRVIALPLTASRGGAESLGVAARAVYDAARMSDLVRRSELMATYAHPYRRVLPAVLGGYGVHRTVALALLLTTAGVALSLAADYDGVLYAAIAALVATLGFASWATAKGVLMIRERTAEWRPRPSELARVRARRPHAPEADRDAAHHEYAVIVGDDDGLLVTYAFIPLAAYEPVSPAGILIAGTPRYEAVEHSVTPFDPLDAARAAEQLAEAQDAAARLEAAAVERTLTDLQVDDEARALVAEARGTGEALRGITGQ
jgi:hypothetical protein